MSKKGQACKTCKTFRSFAGFAGLTLKFYFESLGCAKNLVDSESIISKLLHRGCIQVLAPRDADFIFINTCCFISAARQESQSRIRHLAKSKKNKHAKLIILGCMASRYKEDLKNRMPEIDEIIKIEDYGKFEKLFFVPAQSSIKQKKTVAISLTPRHWSYLRISDGCGHKCSFCVIPKIRGGLKSETIERLIQIAREKAAGGAREINIIAQDSLSYGIDLYGRRALVDLLKKLSAVKGLEWIRILYMYPSGLNDELIDFMKNEEKMCKYFDIPLQHCEDKILKLMKRPYNKEYYKRLIYKIRSKIPESAIRTTFITGFPGETEADFNNLISFARDMRFDHLGGFAYSDEEQTSAYMMKNKVSEAASNRRLRKLLLTQQEILETRKHLAIGKEYDIIVDAAGNTPPRNGYNYIGRTKFDAPEIDRNFYLNSGKILKPGDIVKAKVTKADLYDLYGEMI